MLAFISAGENFPFSLALALMFGIALLEGVTAVFGAALSGAVEHIIPGVDMDGDAHIDVSHAPNALSKMFGWLHVGKVPILMLLVIFLTSFGLLGLGLQSMAVKTFGALLPGWLVAIPASIMTLPVVRVTGRLLHKVMPQDETEAVSPESFVGRVAVIVLGQASHGNSAQAKVKDAHGLSHYILVEPDDNTFTFSQNETVLLVRKAGNRFYAIKNTNDALLDEKGVNE